jgi:hypothetical protein
VAETMGLDLFTIAGLIGAAIIIVAYFATQQGWAGANDPPYLVANLLGACLILLSLYAAWNFPTAVIEGFWAGISLYGLWRQIARTRAN